MKFSKIALVIMCFFTAVSLSSCANTEVQQEPSHAIPEEGEALSSGQPNENGHEATVNSSIGLSDDEDWEDPYVEREAEYHAKDWGKTFGNGRYNFWVTIPDDWQAFDRSVNGDGYFIECGNPDIDMRVFGAHYMPELEGSNQLAGEPFMFGSGDEGFADAGDGVFKCSYLNDAESSVISFYIDYSRDPAWFLEYEETVMKVARTLRDGQRP